MDDTKVLHWLPDEDRWHEVPWNDWAAFRGLMSPSVGLPGISGGIHYFMVCVYDGDLLLNLIPHKYLIEPDGRVGADNFSGLTKEEREDYHRLMIAIENKPENEKRLDEIRNKMSNVFHPPRESIGALKWSLSKRLEPNSAAARFLEQFK